MATFISSSRNLAKYFPNNNIIKRIFTCNTVAIFQKEDQTGVNDTNKEESECESYKTPSEPIKVSSYSDLKVPDFDFYRRKSTLDPEQSSRETLDGRRATTALAFLVGGIVGMYASKTVVHELVASMAITQDMLALAKIEVDLASIPEGKTTAVKWRGKPVFIWHRSQDSIDLARSVDLSKLRDPERDEDRFNRPEWLVVIGVCTHLGCVPLANSGDYGGFYCPCHGTHYDSSGRVRKGPAPTNLVIPEYEFVGDEDNLKMIIG